VQVPDTRVDPGSASYRLNRAAFLRELEIPRELRVVARQRVDPDEIPRVVDPDAEDGAAVASVVGGSSAANPKEPA
jgi:hypothetical protein